MSTNKNQSFSSVSDFLDNDTFIAWRLLRTCDLEAYWDDFMRNNPAAQELITEACRKFEAIRIYDAPLSADAERKMYETILARVSKRGQSRRRRIVYWSAAAACALIFVISGLFLVFRNVSDNSVFRDNLIVGESLPGENVRLIVEGRSVDLASVSHISVSETGEASVTDGAHNTKTVSLADGVFNKLIVPYGKRSFITLADGTRVWLNSGTELEFPSDFAAASRNIRVKGEIYIEVARSQTPFFVHTQQSAVRVLGTKFNVSAYGDDTHEWVVLEEGLVQINGGDGHFVTLRANEKAAVFPDKKITTETVDVSEYTGWRNGVLEFRKTPMEEVLRRVGRYYNISFEESADVWLSEKSVSGKLFLSNNIDSVLTSLSVLSSTRYARENNRIFIRNKTE